MIDEKILKRRQQRLDWYYKYQEREKAKMVKWRALNPEKMKEYREKNRFEYQVRAMTEGNFKRDKTCGLCKQPKKNLQFHHWVYKKPVERKHFSVLCTGCHKLIHRTMRGVKKSQIGLT